MKKAPIINIGAQNTSTSNLFLSLSLKKKKKKKAPPPTDPEANLRARYGGLLPAHKKRGPSLHKGGHLHQHFDSADWSMAKARAASTTSGGSSGASSSLLSSSAAAAVPLPLSATLEEVAPPRLAPEPPAPRRASHLGEASK